MRIRRALRLRRRRQARRFGMVFASLLVLAGGVVTVHSLAQTFGPSTPVDRLQVTDAVSPVIEQSPVWLEIAPAPSEVAPPALAAIKPAPVAARVTQPGKTFNGRALKPVGTKRMLVTAYCPCRKCCGKHANGRTASGYSVWTNGGKLVAADTRILPFGSLIAVPGYDAGDVVPVLDRGGRIKGHRLDLLYPTHLEAKKWGARWLDVTVYDYAD